MNASIDLLAVSVAADLSVLDEWSIQSVHGHFENQLDDDLEQHPYKTAISVSNEGERVLLIKFYHGETFLEQAVEALNQLQNVVVETELRPWPPCWIHAHVLVPTQRTGHLFWVCPIDESVIVEVGSLLRN